MQTPFLKALNERVILGDGALGTYFYDKGIKLGQTVELLNLSDPDLVFSVHQEYIRAGADLIETNTFSANRLKLKQGNVAAVNRAGVEIARRAAGQDIYVAGSVGPSGQRPQKEKSKKVTDIEITDAFREQIGVLVEAGVDLIIIETFTYLDELILAIRAAKEIDPDIPIVAQMVFPSRGRTATGIDAVACAEAAMDAGASVFGSNCGRGVKAVLAAMERLSLLKDRIPLSAFPNAGLPEIIEDRTIYSANPSYMARALVDMIKLGARLVGGCCGTTPVHIHEFKKVLHLKKTSLRADVARAAAATLSVGEDTRPISRGGFLDGLNPDRLPILVELDPPPHLDIEKVLEGAQALKDAGVDAITLAENPLAVLRADNLALAHLIRERTGIQTVLHL
ncbi:MAG: bifunctional homocysteine S-methyltransferase/methylenetetrahydrofolate reductase, partial [Nitrospiraceae bacterium]|nr:bifunctional homocysteine S-methyltransferase/methylenetetrahydrofolate reductase [Nitrospiraceae bacterium]